MFSFHHWFLLLCLVVCIVDCIFHFTNPRVFHHCFFRCFYFTTDFTIVFRVFVSPTFFTVTVFCQVCCFGVVALRVLRTWESFLYSQTFFTLHSFPTFGTTCFYQDFPGASRSALKVARPPLMFEIQIQLICLFKSHSVQQKVVVGRLYLCIKALRRSISTSSRFWTDYLIVICIVKYLSYPLGHRRS